MSGTSPSSGSCLYSGRGLLTLLACHPTANRDSRLPQAHCDCHVVQLTGMKPCSLFSTLNHPLQGLPRLPQAHCDCHVVQRTGMKPCSLFFTLNHPLQGLPRLPQAHHGGHGVRQSCGPAQRRRPHSVVAPLSPRPRAAGVCMCVCVCARVCVHLHMVATLPASCTALKAHFTPLLVALLMLGRRVHGHA